MGNGGNDQIQRHDPTALVQKLEKRMLYVGAGAAEQNWTGGIFDELVVFVHRFAVAFHIKLLQITRQIAQILIVGNDAMAAETEKVVVPNAEQCQNDRNIPVKRRMTEMQIHRVGAVEHFLKVFHPYGKGNRQADRRPHRIAATDEIPEFEHVVGVDAEFFHFFRVGGNGDEMFGNRKLAQSVDQPFAAGFGVGQGFYGGKSFRNDDKQGRFRINLT